jgi:hypothetical protein
MAWKKRSPLKDPPLRNPGQSLDEQIFDLLYDKYLTPISLTLFALLMAGMEWHRSFYPRAPSPMLYSAIALLGIGYCAISFFRHRPRLRALRQARDGEKAVGQYLERLRSSGYRVLHDLVGSGFNVDHVLVGPAGILTVETKTLSKPERGEARIDFDGNRVTINGFSPDRDPIVQAKAQAGWLRELLLESTGKALAVRPIVVYPGWFVEKLPSTTPEVQVLNPKALPSFLAREPARLTPEDQNLAHFHLSRFVRGHERERARSHKLS